MRHVLTLTLAAASLASCSYASIDTCRNADNAFSATYNAQAFNIECVDAAVGDGNSGVTTLGIITTPDPDLIPASEVPGSARQSIQLTILDPQAGRTYAFAGDPQPENFGDAPFEEGAFLGYADPRLSSVRMPETGTVTLTTYTGSSASGTFETMVQQEPLTGSFDVTF